MTDRPKSEQAPSRAASPSDPDPGEWVEGLGGGASRHFLAAIVESSHDAIVGKTLDGVIRSWNPGAERVFGYSAAEAVGRPITLIVPPEREHEEEEILARLRRGERIEHFETERRPKGGGRIEVALSVSPIRDREGRIVGASKVARRIGQRARMEREVERQQETLQAVVQAAPVAISVLDSDGVVHLWNDTSERLFGWTAEEAVGRVSPAVPEDRREELAENVRRTLAGDPLRGVETVRRRKDGEPVEIELWSAVLRDPEGRPDRLVSIAADIGQRKRAERELRESEERFRTLADNIAQLAWMANGDGSIFWYNKRWFDYTGTSLAEMEGWGWKKVHHPEHVDRVVERFAASVSRGEVWEDTFPLRGADGQYRWFLSRAIPILDEAGDVVRWFGTNTDITERREMEEALRNADRRKDEFLATLAHELRNPLAPIVSGLDLLRSLADGGDAQRIVETMQRQTGHLVRMVDDLMDVSRITRGKVELRRSVVELSEVVRDAVETSRPLLDEMRHRLAVDLPERPVRLHGDGTRLAQVFSNLLNNAARHTPKGGRIRVAAGIEGDEVLVTVEDSGSGLEPELVDRVFDLFVQSERSAAQAGGLGIGLTLVKSLVELHGGSVTATSDGIGAGSAFTVRLPIGPETGGDDDRTAEAEDEAVRPEPVDRPAAGLRILVADDNRDAAEALEELLTILGHEARAVYGGAEAVQAARQMRPDVALVDLGMPEVDGLEVARTLRQEPWGGCIHLVALTGWGQDSDRERSREAGFDRHLVKPAALADLREVLAEVPERADSR